MANIGKILMQVQDKANVPIMFELTEYLSTNRYQTDSHYHKDDSGYLLSTVDS